MKIKVYIKQSIKKCLYNYAVNRRRNDAIVYGLNHSASVTPLSQDELNEVNKYWGSLLPVAGKSARCYELLKTYTKWDPRYVSEDIFNSYVIRSLNFPDNVVAFEHKGLGNIVFKGLNQPSTILRRINGSYYDEKGSLLDRETAISIVETIKESVFVKKSIFSNQGKGVMKIDSKGLNIDMLENDYGDDYIVQKPVVQSNLTKRLSKNSLNTFRISTMLLNGKCSLCSIMFRCGRGDSYVDNGYAGNYFVGVDENGNFCDYAYDKNLGKFEKSDTGVHFKGLVIGEVKKLVDFALTNHPQFLPQCGFVGWDLTLDETDSPILIEVNLFSPSVYIEQLCYGQPLFGDRTDEVIAWVKNHVPNYQAVSTNLGY